MDVSSTKKDFSISFLRLLALLSVILTHFFTWLPYDFAGKQIFTLLGAVMVVVFFLISGVLAGNKKIDNPRKWILKSIVKIFVPLYCMIFVAIVVMLLANKNISAITIIPYLFNVQAFIPSELLLPPLRHLWFLSVIFLCYCVNLLLNKYRDNIAKVKTVNVILLFAFLSFLIIAFSFLFSFVKSHQPLALIFAYVVIYVFGYFISARNYAFVSKRNMLIASILSALMIIVRVVSQRFIDNTIFYTVVISDFIFTFVIVITLFLLVKFTYRFIDCTFVRRLLSITDNGSMSIYLAHSIPIYIFGYCYSTYSTVLDIMLVLIGIPIFSLLFYLLTTILISLILRKPIKLFGKPKE